MTPRMHTETKMTNWNNLSGVYNITGLDKSINVKLQNNIDYEKVENRMLKQCISIGILGLILCILDIALVVFLSTDNSSIQNNIILTINNIILTIYVIVTIINIITIYYIIMIINLHNSDYKDLLLQINKCIKNSKLHEILTGVRAEQYMFCLNICNTEIIKEISIDSKKLIITGMKYKIHNTLTKDNIEDIIIIIKNNKILIELPSSLENIDNLKLERLSII